MIARGGKGFREFRAIECVSEEHSAKEHDLGNEKDPHSECGGLSLLLHVLKVMLERGVTCVVHAFVFALGFDCVGPGQFSCSLTAPLRFGLNFFYLVVTKLSYHLSFFRRSKFVRLPCNDRRVFKILRWRW